MQKCYTLLEWEVNRSVTLFIAPVYEIESVSVCMFVRIYVRAHASQFDYTYDQTTVIIWLSLHYCFSLCLCLYILVCVCVCVSLCVRLHPILYPVQYSTAPCCTCVHRESRACSLSTAVYRRTFKIKCMSETSMFRMNECRKIRKWKLNKCFGDMERK